MVVLGNCDQIFLVSKHHQYCNVVVLGNYDSILDFSISFLKCFYLGEIKWLQEKDALLQRECAKIIEADRTWKASFNKGEKEV